MTIFLICYLYTMFNVFLFPGGITPTEVHEEHPYNTGLFGEIAFKTMKIMIL